MTRLEELLDRLESGPRVLVTHYPVRLANGWREPGVRALRDLDRLIEVAHRGGIGLWLHGHRHDSFFHPGGEVAPFPVICAGSATQNGLWTYHEYTILGTRLRALQRVYRLEVDRFHDSDSFELDLACSPSELVSVAWGGRGRKLVATTDVVLSVHELEAFRNSLSLGEIP